MQKIRVLIVDDMEEICNHMNFALKNETNIEVVGTASSGAEAVSLALSLKPDVILMDIQMESDDAGILAGKKILNELPDVKLIALTMFVDSETIANAYTNGFVDYIAKTSSVVEIINAIQNAMSPSGISNDIEKIVLNEMISLKKQQKQLIQCIRIVSVCSKNEFELLRQLCAGVKYKDIAKQRCVEEVSIRSMVTRISNKLSDMPIKKITSLLKECNFFETFDNITSHSDSD